MNSTKTECKIKADVNAVINAVAKRHIIETLCTAACDTAAMVIVKTGLLTKRRSMTDMFYRHSKKLGLKCNIITVSETRYKIHFSQLPDTLQP